MSSDRAPAAAAAVAAAAARAARSTAEVFRSPRAGGPAPAGLDDECVRVDVDPLDPFSPARGRPFEDGDRAGPLALDDEDGAADDWAPFVALFGLAGVMWLFGVLSNALPAASPTVGL